MSSGISVKQIIHVEESEETFEILSDYGASLLVQCFKEDFEEFCLVYDAHSPMNESSWDMTDYLNWDYFLMGLQELYTYSEFMEEFANEVGDVNAEASFNMACELIDDLQQTIGECLDYFTDNNSTLGYQVEAYKFWNDLTWAMTFIESNFECMFELGVRDD